MPLWVRATTMTLLFPGVVAGLIPYSLAHGAWALPIASPLTPWLGWPVLVVGIFLLVWTIWAFAWSGGGTLAPWDAPTALVRGGLYQWVRNPMYVGVLLTILGQGLLWSSGGVLAYAIVMAITFHVRVVQFEEPVLRRQFGFQFDAYLQAVPRWIPRRPRRGVPVAPT
jgi:protein-S-isoprenylcysteine O-methyltransferase Ste14